MPLAGAAFGASQALEKIVADRILAQKLEAEIAHRQQQADLERAQLAQRAREAETQASQGQQRIEHSERLRRDDNNARGLQLMRQDKGDMDLDAAVSGLPDHAKHLGPLLKTGAMGKLSAEDLQDPGVARTNRLKDVEAEAEIRGRVGAKYREPARPNYEKVLVDGKETFMTPEEVRARGGVDVASRKRASTGMERQALGFYNRMKDALDAMDAVEDQLTERDVMLINDSPMPNLINNRLLSSAGQQYAQALSTYTEARLRKESGAAIPESEFTTDRKTISRQAGDKDDLKLQKRQTRRKTAEGVAYAAGPAYEEFYGEPFQRIPDAGAVMQRPIPNIEGGIAESKDGGKTWVRVR